MHKFRVGQAVDLLPRMIRQAASGTYEIIRLVPEHEDDPQYRVKSAEERHERVVPESELSLSTSPDFPVELTKKSPPPSAASSRSRTRGP
jgi:hypothetical protein